MGQHQKKESMMGKNVLVTYASKYGATKEIAEKIGAVLRQAGISTDLMSVEQVRDIAPYQAVILGAAVYIGKWPKEAVKFLQANEPILAGRMVWLFSSGPTGEGDPVQLLEGWLLPDEVKPVINRIHPKGITVFHGHINPEKVNFIEAWAVKRLVKKPMGDFRDWNAITAWTTSIAEAMRSSEPA
jgi:menaquinone-dependent protoporphyrinogen oxidase